MAKKSETRYVYSDEEESIRANAEVIKGLVKRSLKSSDLKEISDCLKEIGVYADGIIEDVDRMAEV